MARPRKQNSHLPPCVYPHHGAFWLVKKNKWVRLGDDLPTALAEYGRLFQPSAESGMVKLIRDAVAVITAKPGLSANTKAQYKVASGILQQTFQNYSSPDQVHGKQVAAMRRAMRDRPNMFNRCLSLLRQIFDYALEEEILEDNPAAAVKRLPEKKRTRLITPEEFDKVYAKGSARLQCMMDIWRITSQRVMDVVKIKPEHLLEEGIYFRQQKTGAELVVKWTPELRAAVARAKLLNGNARSEWLFVARRGKTRGQAPSYKTIQVQWRKACKDAGVEDGQLRDLRAVGGTAAKRQGKDPQKLLGHTDGATTRRYIRGREIPLVEAPSFSRVLDISQKEE